MTMDDTDKDAAEILSPVAATSRIASLDVMRGLAVLGILAVYVVSFGLPVMVYQDASLSPLSVNGANGVARWTMDVFFHQKFITLFSMLFGASIYLVGGERGDAARGKLLRRRLFWLAVIALIDVPWQKHSFTKRMRMTKQEVKDEYKQMEGNPEIKAQIRRRQREMANSRMMDRVKDADVVITNPEHFAVALEYDPTGDGAPIMVAKGSDHMAAMIRAEATAHGVHIFEAPPLARAIYYTTEVENQVPEDLYHAVAQVIAYVFSLEGASPMNPPHPKPTVKVPRNMEFSPEGVRVSAEKAAA